jgi:outer membrane protein assembly factor BamB
VDAETDTLIWPGENGVLYTIKLNTAYDKEAGTIEVNPDKPVKTRYRDNYSKNRYVGYEDSVVVVDHWLYVADNAGMFYCVDLNTMELVWAQDTKDDNNSSPVFEWDDEGNGYIYTAPSLHWTKNSSSKGTVSVYKLDAATGQIIWETPFDCTTVTDLSGGVQATPVLGREGTPLEGLIIYAIARCPSTYRGKLVALSTETGEVVWSMDMAYYTWSSPVALYTDNGTAYVVVCDTAGDAFLVEGKTGKILSKVNLGGLVEASPVAYENMLVVGTRGEKICGLKVS